MTFAYRIRFHLCEGNTLNSDQIRVEFNLDNCDFRLKAAYENSLKETHAIVLGCGGFETEEEAINQGRKLQNCLSVCGAILKRGIDVGKEKTLRGAGQPLKEAFEKRGAQLINDVHGLSVYRDDIETKVLTGHAPSITVSFRPEDFISSLKKAYSFAPDFTEREKIAFDLYNASFFESTINARFLTLVSVVEALSVVEDMNNEVIELVDHLIARSKLAKLEKKNKDSVVNRLGVLKKQSISASTKQLLQKYLGSEEARSFVDIYNIRSSLLHDGVLRCNESEFGKKLNHLNNMVSDLLVKITEAIAPNKALHSTSSRDAATAE